MTTREQMIDALRQLVVEVQKPFLEGKEQPNPFTSGYVAGLKRAIKELSKENANV
jgi:hypothetical protein